MCTYTYRDRLDSLVFPAQKARGEALIHYDLFQLDLRLRKRQVGTFPDDETLLPLRAHVLQERLRKLIELRSKPATVYIAHKSFKG